MSRRPYRRLFDGQRSTVINHIAGLAANESGCVIWDRSLKNGRYGQAYIKDANGQQRATLVHRIVLEEKLGRLLAEGECALHSCDVTRCCNPDHLFLGTHADNMADMKAKGRSVAPGRGVRRFSAADAAIMRAVFDDGATLTDVAAMFGCARGTVRVTLREHGLYPAPELHRGGPLRRRPA